MKKFSFLSSGLAQEEEDANEKEQFFLKNGGLLLEKLISICHGSHNPFRTFSAKDLEKATNNYDSSPMFYDGFHCEWYKGSVEGRQVSVRKNRSMDFVDVQGDIKQTTNQIAMSIKMSNHKGALKLLGCCLETQVPTLVYEFPTNERLIDRIIMPSQNGRDRDRDRDRDSQPPLTWKIRLKIAFEIAHFISYLHTAFPRPILHRNIILHDIFLDNNFVPKQSNFSDSVILPDDRDYFSNRDFRVHLQAYERGTMGYLGPELFHAARFTEKTDIYSFGVLLHQLLTGQEGMIWEPATYVENVTSRIKIYGIDRIMDPKIFEGAGGTSLERQQFHAVYCLAQRCVTRAAEERPAITEVAKELRQISERSI